MNWYYTSFALDTSNGLQLQFVHRMTTEVAVMNRSAVALAADSAVTLQGSAPEGPKIYQTNKLFILSKYQPVGIMIYGAASFMEVPWEIIVKRYRSALGNRGFETLAEYRSHFLTFLERDVTLFQAPRQRKYLRYFVTGWLGGLKHRFQEEAKAKLESEGSLSESKARATFRRIVEKEVEHLRKHGTIERFARTTTNSMIRRYRSEIRASIDEELQDLASSVSIATLELGCALAIMRDAYWPGKSGIVIAGFGTDDVFPHLYCHELDSIMDGRLRHCLSRESHIAVDGVSASLMAFAQGEMVSLFMNGIDEDFSDFIRAFLSTTLFKGYPSLLEKDFEALMSKAAIAKLKKRLQQVGNELRAKLNAGIDEYMKIYHSAPILDIINHLPKEELAAMAEALVNLTSFKRHVTRQAETVGGPIDVAVISHGDGFIWIKRKHYFEKDLNPTFVTNYFRREGQQRGGQ